MCLAVDHMSPDDAELERLAVVADEAERERMMADVAPELLQPTAEVGEAGGA